MNTTNQPTEQLHFSTTGVSCSGCANSLHAILDKLPGVVNVKVDVEGETADVEIERGSLTVADMNKVLEPAGYSLVAKNA